MMIEKEMEKKISNFVASVRNKLNNVWETIVNFIENEFRNLSSTERILVITSGINTVISDLLSKLQELILNTCLKMEDASKLAEKARKNAVKIYEKCPEPFRWIVGDLIDYNIFFWILNSEKHGTVGHQEVLETGFTKNQLKWINETIRQLKGDKDACT